MTKTREVEVVTMEMMEFREEWLEAQVDGLDVPLDEVYLTDDAVEM